jgi:hypothetical protein
MIVSPYACSALRFRSASPKDDVLGAIAPPLSVVP